MRRGKGSQGTERDTFGGVLACAGEEIVSTNVIGVGRRPIEEGRRKNKPSRMRRGGRNYEAVAEGEYDVDFR